MFKSDDELHEFTLLISDDIRFQDVSQPNENVYVSLLLRFENWSLSCKDTSSSQIKTSFSNIVVQRSEFKGENERYRKLLIQNTCSLQASCACHSCRAQQIRQKKCNELGILEVHESK